MKFEPIIYENQKLPCTKSREFSLERDDQRELTIEYYEHDVKNYPHSVRTIDDGINYIDKLFIKNLPAGLKKANTSINVSFTLSADGSLQVNADVIDKSTGKSISHEEVEKESNLE